MAYATKEQASIYRASHRKKIRAYDKRWRKENKDKVREKNKRYEAKIGPRDRKEYLKEYSREYRQRKKEKEFRKVLSDLAYARRHPHRQRDHYRRRMAEMSEEEKEAFRIHKRTWYAENKDILNAKRRARNKEKKMNRLYSDCR